MTHRSNDRVRAESAFKTVQRAQDDKKAKTKDEVEAQFVSDKTARLRALRLAKAAGLEPPVKKKLLTGRSKPVLG